jgi:hypothetical protein
MLVDSWLNILYANVNSDSFILVFFVPVLTSLLEQQSKNNAKK